jgi:hypothetical protein
MIDQPNKFRSALQVTEFGPQLTASIVADMGPALVGDVVRDMGVALTVGGNRSSNQL